MEIEKLPDSAQEKKSEQSGQWLWKNLKPFGCILCLGLMVLMLIICFTSGRDPIPDYAAPMDTAYYAANLGELALELEENVLPHLEGVVSCEEEGGKIVVTIAESTFAKSRSAILRYFDISLFEFIME